MRKYQEYDMSSADFNPALATQSALDFISGLRQYREDMKKSIEQRMEHAEDEIEKMTLEFHDKMMLVDEQSD